MGMQPNVQLARLRTITVHQQTYIKYNNQVDRKKQLK